jgi:ABC-type transport system involved in multi-copper enzyme maturation permease subunit
MMTQLTTPAHTRGPAKRGGFGPVLQAEWIKFATVRGWIIGMLLAPLLIVGIALLNHSECGGNVTPGGPVTTGMGCAAPPAGPGGEAVTDSFYFVRQPLDGNGTITARVTSLTAGPGPAGLGPWSKAGLIIKASTKPGSAYAAVMVTAGHGVRMQDDYTADIGGPPAAASPQWLRLTRSGDTITGYSSADGVRWSIVGIARLPGLPAAAQVGMFAAAPASSQTTSQSVTGSSSTGALTLAVARFDHVTLASHRPNHSWAGGTVGGTVGGATPETAPGTGFHQAGGIVTVTGTGDIAPYVAGADGGTAATIISTLQGTVAGLIAAVVVATMFMTSEYRRGLIRVTFAAAPGRGRVLAAKAAVIGSVTFLAGLAGATVAAGLGERILRSNGNVILPASLASNVRVVAGTAALLAVAAVLALALGAIFRRSAAAITVVIAAIVLPYLLALTALPGGAADWLLRLTPAAAFAIQQTTPQYPQVSASYTVGNGYFPLAPWAGFAVLCGYAVLALGAAIVGVRRRDA